MFCQGKTNKRYEQGEWQGALSEEPRERTEVRDRGLSDGATQPIVCAIAYLASIFLPFSIASSMPPTM
jgi:hypothetical protein